MNGAMCALERLRAVGKQPSGEELILPQFCSYVILKFIAFLSDLLKCLLRIRINYVRIKRSNQKVQQPQFVQPP